MEVLADLPRAGCGGKFTSEQIAMIITVACEPPENRGVRSREPAYAEVVPNLSFGRRLLARECTAVRWVSVLDLAAEFTEARPLRELAGYRSLPVLDATSPTVEQLRSSVAWLTEVVAIGPVYVHCALGMVAAHVLSSRIYFPCAKSLMLKRVCGTSGLCGREFGSISLNVGSSAGLSRKHELHTQGRPPMPRFKVVVTDFVADELATEKRILGDIADIEAFDANTEADLVGRIETANAIMIYHNVSLGKETIARLTNCKVIVRCGVGYDNVDWRFARERGIAVANVPDYGTEEVADSAIGMALTLARGIHLYNSRLQEKKGPWSYTQAAPIVRLRGRVFGLVGLGRIGSATALRAKALGMDVVFFDPYQTDGYDKALGIRRVERLADLLAQSHVVSVHCPLTEETKHIIDAAAIAKMTRGSFLVNTARGACVDLAAVPPAIASGQLAGAGIDVLPHEPPPDDHPLLVAWRDPNHLCHDRLIVNPHAAFYSEEGLLDMRVKGAETCRKALLGEPMRNVVNG